jgi:hypothetical protein
VSSVCRVTMTELLCTPATIAVDLVAVVTAGGQLVYVLPGISAH